LEFEIEGRGIGAVLALDGNPDPALIAFLAKMKIMTQRPLSAFDGEWKPLPQNFVPIEPTKPYNQAPEGMLAIPAGPFSFRVSGVELEEDAGYVDVQYPWEGSPRRNHDRPMRMKRFFLDRDLVTNDAYVKFVKSGYRPSDTGAYLLALTAKPTDKARSDAPVTSVSLEDARAYCRWAGKRLPHEWEWQYAAQGQDGRAYPWGNSWRDDAVPAPDTSRAPRLPDAVGAHPSGTSPFGVRDMVGLVWQWTDEVQDAHTRSAILRGGSYYQPQGSRWYFPQAYRNDQHNKLLLMAPSKDRSSMIGFRCAADAADQ
jgi:gamma-glutamyl hercynylcysteine S-oxide synthase